MAVQTKDFDRRLATILETVPSENNRQTIVDYLGERRANGVKPPTLLNEANTLRDLAVQLDQRAFDSVKKPDIVQYVNTRERVRVWRSRAANGKITEVSKKVHIQDSTMAVRKVDLKAFFKWLRDTDEYPPEVKWLKTRRPDNGSIPVDDLVTPDDLRAILQAHPDQQHKAVFAVLYETGMRPGEMCALDIGDVQFDQYGAVFLLPRNVEGLKTGARRIRMFRTETGTAYLHAWFENHPKKHDKKAALFYSQSRRAPGARMNPKAVWYLCDTANKRLGLGKDLNPKLFRHTAATNKAREGWSEAEMRAFFGWSRSSPMPAVYVHLAGLDYEEMALERKGLKAAGEASERSGLAPKTCKLCRSENLPTAIFCQSCRGPISPDAEADLSQRHDELLAELVQREMARVLGAAARQTS